MAYRRWIKGIGLSALTVLLASGCSMFNAEDTGQAIDPPQQETVAGTGSAGGAVPVGGTLSGTGADTGSGSGKQSQSGQVTMPVTVYLQDENGLMAPVTLSVPFSESVARVAMEHLVSGGPVDQLAPKGFKAVLPAGTKIISLDIKDKSAVVDLSKEFAKYDAKDERRIMEAITWTLTSLPSVESVQLRINGQALKEMPVAKTPLDEPLTRAKGINLEKSANVQYGQATPVTVYFVGKTSDEFSYYVPVTRLVPLTDNAAKAAVEQLIAGPFPASKLHSVLLPDVEAIDVKTPDPAAEAKTVTVNLSAEALGPDSKLPAEAAQALVLTMTEMAGVHQVNIQIEGKSDVKMTDNQNAAKAMARPSKLNPIKS
ncbi:GerMN domain-containing protein [Paenibacillus thermoaerophilus]|uniref:GerMN domain-containing protein n=1 Tax=Paenibacillus thermoaerophilus TaxID=1215385 RepID=A0ABW2V8L9_9BACL|nr:GerMN domain-containing protein [Paenibacillus thermoaerophilus]TMV17660.1 stage II sporulation protein [Paenibacillus thermoaerophilus]